MTAVTASVLADLGFNASCPFDSTASYGTLYPALGEGEVDLLVAEWRPAHAKFYEPLGDTIEDVGLMCNSGGFYWAVPEYVDPSSLGLTSIGDLVQPEVMAKLSKNITAAGGTSFLATAAVTMMDAYGLTDAGYSLNVNDYPSLIRETQTRLANKEAFVVTAFGPSFFGALPLVPLSDPKGVDGPTNKIFFMKHSGFTLGDRVDAVLSRVQFTDQDVASMDARVAFDGLTPEEAATRWIHDNPNTYKSWFA